MGTQRGVCQRRAADQEVPNTPRAIARLSARTRDRKVRFTSRRASADRALGLALRRRNTSSDGKSRSHHLNHWSPWRDSAGLEPRRAVAPGRRQVRHHPRQAHCGRQNDWGRPLRRGTPQCSAPSRSARPAGTGIGFRRTESPRHGQAKCQAAYEEQAYLRKSSGHRLLL